MVANVVFSFSGLLLLGILSGCSPAEETAETWSISSPVVAEGSAIPVDHTCEGRPFPVPLLGNPELTWTEGPAGTQSYALVLKHLAISEATPPSDPAYARGFMWAIWDIPASVRSLPANMSRAQFPTEVPGAQQWSNRNQFGFFAPCPNAMLDPAAAAADPSLRVTDRYGFALYAIGTPNVALPPRPSDVANYTMTLTMHLDANNLGMVQLTGTSNAVPSEFVPPETSLQYPAAVTEAPAMYPTMAPTAAPPASTL